MNAPSRRHDESEAAEDGFSERDMTFRVVQELCRTRGVYTVPACNTILYLHQQNFRNVRGLDQYVACKVLHLENNCLSSVEGIACLRNLRVLYLQSNAITSLNALEICDALDTLNISGNPIRDLQGLPPNLSTLHAARIGLSGESNVKTLVNSCRHLQVVDLSHNSLEGDTVLSILAELSADIERVGAEAWQSGGVKAERAARTEFWAAKRRQERGNVTSFALQRASRRAVRESLITATQALEMATHTDAILQAHRVATAEAVDALEVQQITAAWNTPFVECSICSEQFCTQDCITSLPCAHVFHAGCIRPWLLSFSDSCPLCRQAATQHRPGLSAGSSLKRTTLLEAGIHAGGRVHAYVRVKLTASSCKEDGVKLTVQLESDIDRKAQGMANQPLSGAQLSQGLGTPAYRQQVEPAPENSPRSRETPCRDDKKSEPADFADSDGCGDVWDLDCNITVSAMPYM
eukprot:jgi/Tetstr1/437547/TSEL_026219.t1